MKVKKVSDNKYQSTVTILQNFGLWLGCKHAMIIASNSEMPGII